MDDRIAQQLGVDSISKFKPNAGMLVVQREPVDKTTKHGIVIVRKRGDEDQRWDISYATVIKHGACELTKKTRLPIPFETQVGDRVCIARFAGHDLALLDGTQYVLVAESDIHCILEPASADATNPATPERAAA